MTQLVLGQPPLHSAMPAPNPPTTYMPPKQQPIACTLSDSPLPIPPPSPTSLQHARDWSSILLSSTLFPIPPPAFFHPHKPPQDGTNKPPPSTLSHPHIHQPRMGNLPVVANQNVSCGGLEKWRQRRLGGRQSEQAGKASAPSPC
uniref:Uncharacterized protein n=1 Tax=Sphaerodactylus townsendi TaxID=933632 RepID=A0ACB8FPM8_9SAUR